MARVPRQIAEELLPSIFRRGRRVTTPPLVGDEYDLGTANVLQDPLVQTPKPTLAEQAIARAQPVPDVTQPIATQPATPAAVMPPNVLASGAAYGTLSRSGQIRNENAIRERRVETNKQGRPTPNIALQGDPDEQTLDYHRRVAQMPEDKEGGGWWPKIRAALLGFAAGGPVGAAAGFGTRALREHFDPTLGSREFKRQKLGELAPAVGSIYAARKEKRAEEAQDATTGLAKARTDALKNPKTSQRIIQRKDGVYMLNPKTNKFEKVEEIPAEPGSPASARYFKTNDGVWKIDAEHPEGVRVRNIPGTPGKAGEDVEFGNARVRENMTRVQASMDKINKALFNDDGSLKVPKTIEGFDFTTGTKKQVPNPDYTYNMSEYRRLEKELRDWNNKLKSPKKGVTTKADDPLGLFDEEPDEEP